MEAIRAMDPETGTLPKASGLAALHLEKMTGHICHSMLSDVIGKDLRHISQILPYSRVV